MNNIQSTYFKLGRYLEAEEMAIRVLEGFREVYGADHPLTFQALYNLGTIYCATERFEESERTLQEACDACGRH